MSYLPEEIIFNILSRLPAKCILRSRCVCKSWFELFKSHNFVSMHLDHNTIANNNTSLMFNVYDNEIHSIEYDSLSHSSLSDRAVQIEHPLKDAGYQRVRIEATCNGLVCISLFSHFKAATLILWNPYTREYKEIPMPYQEPRNCDRCRFRAQISKSDNVKYWLAYDRIINDYKLVIIETLHGVSSALRVLTLGSNAWKLIRHINYINFTREQPGIFIHGAFHWTATATYSKSQSIVSFDMGEENVKEVPIPKYLDDKVSIGLGLLEGCLCILSHTEEVSTDVWVMKEYGVGDSWTKLFSITDHTITVSKFVRPLQFYNNGDILILKNCQLLLYNPKHKRTTIVKIPCQEAWYINVYALTTYVGSFVSLNSGTYVGQNQEERKDSFQPKSKKLKTTNFRN